MTPHATDSLGLDIMEKDRKTSENDTFVLITYGFVLFLTQFHQKQTKNDQKDPKSCSNVTDLTQRMANNVGDLLLDSGQQTGDTPRY